MKNEIFKIKNKTLQLVSISLILFCPFSLKAAEPSPAPGSAAAEGKLKSVSGYIKDASDGEALIGATVLVRELKKGAAANTYGFYSVSLLPGKYTLDFSYVGYKTETKTIELKENTTLNIELSNETKEINEVVVKAESTNDKLKRPEMSVQKLEMKTIKKVPALMGEVDVIKVIQMLPGVVSTSEGSSGFSVRGGGIDQNLIILDEATVYNASHLMGFFSVFNNDAISNVKLYKGDIPANYGGRLSSVLDVRMKEGNMKKWSAAGGLGLIASRLTIEGPIAKDKAAILISGRRTYADLFFPLATDKNLKKSKLYFYDLNLKGNAIINQNNRVFVSGYLGRDIFGQKGAGDIGFGNKTATVRWNHQYSGKLFSNLTGIASTYDYDLFQSLDSTEYSWKSNLTDYGLKLDFNWFANTDNEIKFGVSSTYHTITPCDAYSKSSTVMQYFPKKTSNSYEHGIYATNQQKIGDKLTLKYGIRYSIFQNVGKGIIDRFDDNHNYIKSDTFKAGKLINTYTGWEPRLGVNFTINDVSSVKASYSRTYQYLQLASNSNGGMPLDYWFPASPNVKPQESDQYGLGYFHNLFDNTLETSVEFFYKDMRNVIDFRDHADLLFNDRLEGDVRTGKGYSYGAEVLIRKNEGAFTGWISYTYSRAFRKVAAINEGKEYQAPYDKPHNVNLVLNYEFTPRISASANFVYATGTPMTKPLGLMKLMTM
ncbi:MAG TPA: TonB-dependent receptor [Bacteroidales bacterium]|nr:TonB-dependent receptor [Bacteroidales bacterium]